MFKSWQDYLSSLRSPSLARAGGSRRLITVFQSRLEFGDGLYVPRNLSNASNSCSSFPRGKRIVLRLRGKVIIAFKDTFGAYGANNFSPGHKEARLFSTVVPPCLCAPRERVARKERLQRPGICDAQLTKGFSPLHPSSFSSSRQLKGRPPHPLTRRLIYNELLLFNSDASVTAFLFSSPRATRKLVASRTRYETAYNLCTVLFSSSSFCVITLNASVEINRRCENLNCAIESRN